MSVKQLKAWADNNGARVTYNRVAEDEVQVTVALGSTQAVSVGKTAGDAAAKVMDIAEEFTA